MESLKTLCREKSFTPKFICTQCSLLGANNQRCTHYHLSLVTEAVRPYYNISDREFIWTSGSRCQSVPSCVYVHMSLCTPVNRQVGIQKTPPCKLQMMTTTSVSYVFALVDGKKHHQCKLQRVKTILGTSRSRMRQPIAGSTRALLSGDL